MYPLGQFGLNPLTTLVLFPFTHVIDVRFTTGAIVVVVVVVVVDEVVFDVGAVVVVAKLSGNTIWGPGREINPKFCRAIPAEFMTVARA